MTSEADLLDELGSLKQEQAPRTRSTLGFWGLTLHLIRLTFATLAGVVWIVLAVGIVMAGIVWAITTLVPSSMLSNVGAG